jgi:hypothetical protein
MFLFDDLMMTDDGGAVASDVLSEKWQLMVTPDAKKDNDLNRTCF